MLAAAFSTFATGIDAGLHIADSFAALGAILADIHAFGADMLGVIAAHQHKMRACPANLRAGQHQPQMLRFNVLAASLEAMVRSRSKAGLIALQAVVDACLHVLRSVVHDLVLLGREPTKKNNAA